VCVCYHVDISKQFSQILYVRQFFSDGVNFQTFS